MACLCMPAMSIEDPMEALERAVFIVASVCDCPSRDSELERLLGVPICGAGVELDGSACS